MSSERQKPKEQKIKEWFPFIFEIVVIIFSPKIELCVWLAVLGAIALIVWECIQLYRITKKLQLLTNHSPGACQQSMDAEERKKKKLIKRKKRCRAYIFSLMALCLLIFVSYKNVFVESYQKLRNPISYEGLPKDPLGQRPLTPIPEIGKDEQEENEDSSSKEEREGQQKASPDTDWAESLGSYHPESSVRLVPSSYEHWLTSEEFRNVFFGALDFKFQPIITNQVVLEEAVKSTLDSCLEEQLPNTLLKASPEIQAEIFQSTQNSEKFMSDVQYKKENSPALEGSELWYSLLPPSDELDTIIAVKEKYFGKYYNSDCVQLMYNDYFFLASEHSLQQMDPNAVVYYYGKAALMLMEKLKFDDLTKEEQQTTISDLKAIYELLAEEPSLNKTAQNVCERIVRAMKSYQLQ